MVTVGDLAPEFSTPLVTDEMTSCTLSEAIVDGPVILAFFPGAFTSVCTGEMRTFRDRIGDVTDAGATLYGISTDSPFALREFREQNDLPFGLLSDHDRELVTAYDLRADMESVGIHDVADRAVVIVDPNGRVTYRWVGETLGDEPDYDGVIAAARDAAD
ncbi:peroxiredoxin [Halobacteriales archaeon SW_7_68_16]|nr:MAG: peroxiredoxin [Halobacteriales archaeon SW_7_68_16]